jgi:hypothetical protein
LWRRFGGFFPAIARIIKKFPEPVKKATGTKRLNITTESLPYAPFSFSSKRAGGTTGRLTGIVLLFNSVQSVCIH